MVDLSGVRLLVHLLWSSLPPVRPVECPQRPWSLTPLIVSATRCDTSTVRSHRSAAEQQQQQIDAGRLPVSRVIVGRIDVNVTVTVIRLLLNSAVNLFKAQISSAASD